jgi:drug/metabolite transporter (DMT)-like permease
MWIPITLAAATFQILRTARQHQLRDRLGTNAAGFVRYAYGAPLALLTASITFLALDRPLPEVAARFWPIVTAAGVSQILGTIALLRAFRLRDFALGTVYAKTEVIQVAIIGAVLLGEPLAPWGWVGAGVVTVSVAWLAGRGSLRAVLRRAGDPAALLGIAAGGLFGGAAVGIRAASGSLDGGTAWDRALVTLTVMLVIQALLNGTHLALTARTELAAVARHWRVAAPVGVLSLAGSAGWALAVTLENAAKVRTLGQVELLLAFTIGRIRFGEEHTRAEYLAAAAVAVGIAMVVLA